MFFNDINGLLLSMGTSFKAMFKPCVTIDYPKKRAPTSNRFRGEHYLGVYENNVERCIACKLCEVICPAQAITIESIPSEDSTRRATVYTIDMTKCIYCGLCQEACPTNAIVQGKNQEFCVYDRKDLVYQKEKLLENQPAMDKNN